MRVPYRWRVRRILAARIGVAGSAVAVCGLALAGCQARPVSAPVSVETNTTTATTSAPRTAPSASHSVSASRRPTVTSSTPARTVTHPPPTTPTPNVVAVPAGTGPVIVIDPGHSPTITATDPATGLNVSDYENEPEMGDVFEVALLVKAKLQAVGYRVILTKSSATQPTSLGQRAQIANSAHAALALSIHDQAGSNGGIGFGQGNNIVYYQAVGDYRDTPAGKRVVFSDSSVAALSKKYGQIFQSQRSAAEGHSITLQSNVGYDLGSRGLPAGNIWIVQLLSKVPWIYNEAGGNSSGMAGLNAADKQRYADGLVASVEHCVPPS